MVVNTNILAVNSHRNMKNTTALQARSSARLSSGLKINSAADDAAGLAISEKMRAQIRGLDMASKNTQDATSLIQTAEGGMQEVDNMIQRMRELTVQAANGTNEFNTENGGDRQKIQDELNMLAEEIDSMSDRVEFNNKKVISGDYADDYKAQQNNLNDTIKKAQETLTKLTNKYDSPKTIDTVYADASKAVAGNGTTSIGTSGVLASFGTAVSEYNNAVNAVKVGVTDVKTALAGLGVSTDVQNKLDGLNVESTTFSKDITAILKEAAAEIKVIGIPGGIVDDVAFIQGLDGLGATNDLSDAFALITSSETAETKDLADAIKALHDGAAAGTHEVLEAIHANFTADPTNDAGTSLTFTDNADFLAQYEAAKIANTEANATLANAKKDIDDKAAATKTIADSTKALADLENEHTKRPENFKPGLYFQVGANADQKLEISIKSVNTKALGLRDADGKFNIDVVTEDSSSISKLITKIDDALTYVTSERSKLGAAQNRLEYTQKSLDISSENLTASESRIRDTDMAKEMMNLTKANVLSQAAQSMLAQANQAPQGVLQLLR